MKVKNGSCIRRLSFKTLMAARKRNIIAVLAIALTALLFTSLFTIVMSINETNQNYQFRSVGGYAHGAFKDVDEDQIKVLSAHPDVKAVGVRTVLGLATQGAFEKEYAEVSYMDDNNAKWSFSQPTVGRTPKSGNEITMDTKAMELLGVKPELGAQVKLTYTLADKEQMGWDVTDTFTLVGWWDYDELLSVHFLNVSKEYAQKIDKLAVAGGLKPFRTDLSVMLRSSLNIENDLTRIGEDCGYSIGEDAGQLRIGVNWGYTATQVWDTLGVGGILAMLAVLILVAFTGYLVIYNIFQISVAGDIRYYGLLKTIGVTPKQLRRLIRQQALLLSRSGHSGGLAAGLRRGRGGGSHHHVHLYGGRAVHHGQRFSLDIPVFHGVCPADGAAVLRPAGTDCRESLPCGGGVLHRAAVVGENAPEGRQGHPHPNGSRQLGQGQKEDGARDGVPVPDRRSAESAGHVYRRL